MKRKLVLCASALVLAIGSAFAADSVPSSTSAIEKAVAARSLAFAKAALKGDLATFPTFMSDDYVPSNCRIPRSISTATWPYSQVITRRRARERGQSTRRRAYLRRRG